MPIELMLPEPSRSFFENLGQALILAGIISYLGATARVWLRSFKDGRARKGLEYKMHWYAMALLALGSLCRVFSSWDSYEVAWYAYMTLITAILAAIWGRTVNYRILGEIDYVDNSSATNQSSASSAKKIFLFVVGLILLTLGAFAYLVRLF